MNKTFVVYWKHPETLNELVTVIIAVDEEQAMKYFRSHPNIPNEAIVRKITVQSLVTKKRGRRRYIRADLR